MLWLDCSPDLPDRSTSAAYALAYRGWPSVALLGPILLMLVAIPAYPPAVRQPPHADRRHRRRRGSRQADRVAGVSTVWCRISVTRRC